MQSGESDVRVVLTLNTLHWQTVFCVGVTITTIIVVVIVVVAPVVVVVVVLFHIVRLEFPSLVDSSCTDAASDANDSLCFSLEVLFIKMYT